MRIAIWRRWTDLPLLILAVGSLPLLLLELVSDRLTHSDRNFVFGVNVAVFIAFAISYVVEIFLSESRVKYAKSEWLSLLIVIAQLLALLPAMGFFGVLRGARALRVIVTLLRVVGIGVASRTKGREVLKKRAASMAFGLAGFTLVTSAVAFTLAEDVGESGRIRSFFDALWWSAATITTVGYGDIYPVTAAGRIIAVFTMVVGVSTLAVVTARIAQFLIQDDSENEQQIDR
jgi:voltage-gated potassium channel